MQLALTCHSIDTFTSLTNGPHADLFSNISPSSSSSNNNNNNARKVKKLHHKVISKLHKFSVGKTFDSTELDTANLLKVTNNKSVYENVPATLSTRGISTFSKYKHVNTDSSSELNRFFSSISLSKQIPAASSSINLNRINIKTGGDILNKILNDILVEKAIDYASLAKGRSVEDTKAVLNYMILALHQIKSKEQENFNSMKYLDQVRRNRILFLADHIYIKRSPKIYSKFHQISPRK